MHWLTTTWGGGFILGVIGNLVASALLVLPALARQAESIKAHSTTLHRETRANIRKPGG